jgi:ketosteroid isomerase-like protein
MLRDMAQAETIRVAFRDVSVSRAGSVAWISCGLKFDVTVADGHVIIDGRFTALLEHRDYKWFFMQAHYSVPAEDQEVGHSYPLS